MSKQKLYKENRKYYYSLVYDGYTTTGTDSQSEYQQRLLDPFAKPQK